MLGDRQHNSPPWLGGAEHLREDNLVFFNMLQHIEGADHIKLGLERDTPSIHLKK